VDVERLGRDRYGRELVYLGHEGQDVGCLLVATGHAWAYTRYPGGARYAAAERTARAQGIGLWAADDPIPPERWRRQH
jgi:endonuclease YncB( thermonuclease family)